MTPNQERSRLRVAVLDEQSFWRHVPLSADRFQRVEVGQSENALRTPGIVGELVGALMTLVMNSSRKS